MTALGLDGQRVAISSKGPCKGVGRGVSRLKMTCNQKWGIKVFTV